MTSCVSKSDFCRPLRWRTERFVLPEFGEGSYVVIQAITSKDLVALQSTYGSEPTSDNRKFVYDLFAHCLVNDSGANLFAGAAEAEECLNLSLPAMEALVEACLRVSGIEVKKVNEEKTE